MVNQGRGILHPAVLTEPKRAPYQRGRPAQITVLAKVSISVQHKNNFKIKVKMNFKVVELRECL